MNERLTRFLRAAGDAIVAQRALLIGVAVVIAAVASAVVLGTLARSRAAASGAEAGRLERTVAVMDRWVDEFQEPTEDEALSWRQTERRFTDVGVTENDRIGLARSVAERVELVGLPDATLTFVETDALSVPAAVGTGWSASAGPFGLRLVVQTDLNGLVDLLGALPPQIIVQSVELARAGGTLQATLLLATYAIEVFEGSTQLAEETPDGLQLPIP